MKEVNEMEIKIQKVDSKISIEINGTMLPTVFDEYHFKSSNSAESELALIIHGDINVSELLTSLKAQM